eukprot:TRINITY_DN91329_c0_g1_i1.p1 TRINITY_DN91329_c0_g1~~TRINITY_DN91329_c0_g1_i1.p1  ORF type:complete len:332 (+),score=74.00 TRINITY_DN91329_c0_g1_i1:63-1058(+)
MFFSRWLLLVCSCGPALASREHAVARRSSVRGAADNIGAQRLALTGSQEEDGARSRAGVVARLRVGNESSTTTTTEAPSIMERIWDFGRSMCEGKPADHLICQKFRDDDENSTTTTAESTTSETTTTTSSTSASTTVTSTATNSTTSPTTAAPTTNQTTTTAPTTAKANTTASTTAATTANVTTTTSAASSSTTTVTNATSTTSATNTTTSAATTTNSTTATASSKAPTTAEETTIESKATSATTTAAATSAAAKVEEDEAKPPKLPGQGYDGRRVRHEDGKTQTSDWLKESPPVKAEKPAESHQSASVRHGGQCALILALLLAALAGDSA